MVPPRYIKEVGDFTKDNHSGRNLLFGIREHAMGAIVNGIAYYGIFRPSVPPLRCLPIMSPIRSLVRSDGLAFYFPYLDA